MAGAAAMSAREKVAPASQGPDRLHAWTILFNVAPSDFRDCPKALGSGGLRNIFFNVGIRYGRGWSASNLSRSASEYFAKACFIIRLREAGRTAVKSSSSSTLTQ